MIGPGARLRSRSFPALMIVAPPVENRLLRGRRTDGSIGEIGRKGKKGSEKCVEKERAIRNAEK